MNRHTFDETANILKHELKELRNQGCNPFALAELENYLKEYLSAPTKRAKRKALTKFFMTKRELLSN